VIKQGAEQMIGKPMPHPRDIIIFELEEQKAQFLAAGNSIQKIATGLSALDTFPVASSHQKMLKSERAKFAPALREYAKSGLTINKAAKILKLKIDRAQMIVREHRIKFVK
jgi:hypothetical protein